MYHPKDDALVVHWEWRATGKTHQNPEVFVAEQRMDNSRRPRAIQVLQNMKERVDLRMLCLLHGGGCSGLPWR